ACGVTKLRLTGGEPLMRSDLIEIVGLVSKIEGIKEISVTTNGILLTKELAINLKKAGLNRINISLDSLNPERYKKITSGGKLADVLAGIDAALLSSLKPLHLNVVLTKGINDDEADDFIHFAKNNPVTVRFIELMPFLPNDEGKGFVPNSEILARHPYLIPVESASRAQPSLDYSAEGWQGKVGFISPITNKFCGDCNRVRLLSNGSLKPCLGSEEETDLKPFINDEALLIEAIKKAIFEKPKGHHFERGCTIGHSLQSIGG
ncbi:MAG: radical SAM protein, partial [Eubacteriales bacterium]